MVNPGPNNPCFVADNPVRDLTRSPLRKKPHIQKEEQGGPQGCFLDSSTMTCKFEEEEQPSGSSGDQGKRNITMADRKDYYLILFLFLKLISSNFSRSNVDFEYFDNDYRKSRYSRVLQFVINRYC